jgi:iron complex transport system substrate-binding protein
MFSYSLPQRIVCLTEETTETLYLLGAEDLIVGISGFTVRPKEVRKQKPKVSTYLDANFTQILDLKPDVVLAWSDLQADICAELIRQGVEVMCFNHRSITGILSMMLRLGALVGKMYEAERLVERITAQLKEYAAQARNRPSQPRVYFEEWYDPLISGIAWVSELIELCGGTDIFVEHRQFPDAKRRIIADPEEVIRRNPEIILASWCGKMFKPERLKARTGWDSIEAVRHNRLFELHSSVILQPGPAALTDGASAIMRIFDQWAEETLKKG